VYYIGVIKEKKIQKSVDFYYQFLFVEVAKAQNQAENRKKKYDKFHILF